MSSDIFTIALVVFVLFASFATVIGIGGTLHFEPRFRAFLGPALPVLLVAGFGLGTLFSGRKTSLYGVAQALTAGASTGMSEWILRLATMTIVVGSAFVVLSYLLRRAKRVDAAWPLFVSLSGYFFSAYVISGVLGTSLFISHKTFYPFMIFFALYVTSDQHENLLLRSARDSLFIFLLLGLILIPLAPDLVRQDGYAGFIPGLSFRYWGLASHANNIGPLAVFFMLLVSWLPYRSRYLLFASVAVAALTLLLAQSKTTYIGIVIVGGVFIIRWWMMAVVRQRFGALGSMLTLALGVGLLFLLLIILIAGLYDQPFDRLLAKLHKSSTLFTGREVIWSITIAEWSHNPFFGYGPGLWGDEFSAKHGYLGIASNAHNQILDTLGASGYFGVAALLLYFIVLVRYALLLAKKTGWISVALVVFVGVRCISEVPLKTINVTTSDFFMHAVLVGLFMRAMNSQVNPVCNVNVQNPLSTHSKFA
jgi:exopolysaccharide production protein ExoQ